LLGIQNADHETAASFLGEAGHRHGDDGSEENEEGFEETVGGWPRSDREPDGLEDYLYLVRSENSAGLPGGAAAMLGLSGLFGPNAAGEDTRTAIYGADLTLAWRPDAGPNGAPVVEWKTEIMRRDYETAGSEVVFADGEPESLPAATLDDWGLYSQVVWGFAPGWSAGLRVEYATADGEGAEPRDEDPNRDDRTRIAPLLTWRPSGFSRLRLQYNYDRADHLEDEEAHTVWLGLELLYGDHAPHCDHPHEACAHD
jgi:hypothetical protein